jgi:hypothetical protein
VRSILAIIMIRTSFVWSVLLRYTDSDYPFGIFKLFLPIINLVGKTLPLRNVSLDCHGYEDTVDIIRNICSAMGQEGRKIITKLIYLQCESSFVK